MVFTMAAYTDLLERLRDAGREFVGFHGAEPGTVVLRHDVDISVDRALAMARLEVEMGITATYCFLLTPPVYDLLHSDARQAVEEIEALGHEVGLHFDPHHYWDKEPPRGRI